MNPLCSKFSEEKSSFQIDSFLLEDQEGRETDVDEEVSFRATPPNSERFLLSDTDAEGLRQVHHQLRQRLEHRRRREAGEEEDLTDEEEDLSEDDLAEEHPPPVDPETQARLEALLEAAGISKLAAAGAAAAAAAAAAVSGGNNAEGGKSAAAAAAAAAATADNSAAKQLADPEVGVQLLKNHSDFFIIRVLLSSSGPETSYI